MELKYIRIFTVFADKGFSQAAAELHISKGLLSKYLSKLEEILGVELYIRSGGKMKLNADGELFLVTARKILALEEEYLVQLRRRQNRAKNIFSVGSIYQMAPYHIVDMLLEFYRKNPGVLLDIQQEQEDDQLYDDLREGKVEIAFVRHVPEGEAGEFDCLLYCLDRYCFALPQNHPLAKEKSIRPQLLKDEKFVLLPERTAVTRDFYHIAHGAGFEPQVIARFEGGDNIQEAVAKGYGISVLMRTLTEHQGDMVALVDMEPDQIVPVYMLRPKNRPSSETAVKFWNFVENNLKLQWNGD